MVMELVFDIPVDLKEVRSVNTPLVTQNDSVVFILTVTENGIPFDLTDATTVSLTHNRQGDGTVVVTMGTRFENKATFVLNAGETSVAGGVIAKAQFYDADGRVSSLSFGYQVGKDPTGVGYTPSENEQTLIEVVLNDGPLIIQSAEEAAAYANEQGDYALQVGVDNETRYLNAVSSVALRDSTYPLPAHGDTVRITELGRTDRYVLGTGWVTTDVYNPTAIDNLNQQLAEMGELVDGIDRGYGGTYATLSALQTAFPAGNENRYVISADGKWYYWNTTTLAWTVGGVFQSTGLGSEVVNPQNTTFISQYPNLMDKSKIVYSSASAQTGILASTFYDRSEYIPVFAGQTLTFTQGIRYVTQHNPDKTGDYRKGWTRKKDAKGFIIHNKTDYQLTHLLENGHAKVGGGRVAARVHIRPVEEQIVADFEKLVKKAIQS